MKSVGKVLQRRWDISFQVNAKKSSFTVNQTDYLSFIMTQGGVKPNPKKVAAIFRLASKNLRQLRGIIGLANY